MTLDDAQRWADEFLDERAAPPSPLTLESLAVQGPDTGFSPFIVEDAERARECSRELMTAADEAGGGEAGLAAAQARAEELLAEQDRALVRFALKLFLTHHPDGRRLRIPALERRAPQKVVPSGPPPPPPPPGLEATGIEEAVLNWWREDPEANEHHDHWHAVYPTVGIADGVPGDPGRSRLQDRQGELFFYMHQQMLARYDHERVAVGLPRVEPLEAYGAAIPEGYDPTQGLKGLPPGPWLDDEQPSPRPDGASMPASLQLGPGRILQRSDLEAWRDRLLQGATSSSLRNPAGQQFEADIDHLGHAAEPSRAVGQIVDRSKVPDGRHYGNLHGLGHVFLAVAAGAPLGVMADTDTAIRDPVFYRWHRHIDNVGFEWQKGRPGHNLTLHAAKVGLRHGARPRADRPAESPDLILVREDDLPEGLEGNALRSHIENAPGTDELQTEMRWRPLEIEPPVPGMPQVDIPYLDKHPFAYAVRMENTRGEDHDVTVRLFLVADALFDERRMWIELDKFHHRVEGERSVAVRHARESSVIRKPASERPGPTRHSPAREPGVPIPFDEESYCECGWPYNLLIPRGTAEGMPFWLAAIVTDWEQDRVTSSSCGSMSFCGARDRYPDQRPMGYPFDRPITGEQIATALSEQPHMAARSFRIRWLNPAFPD
jgi:tyrosinase